MSSPAFNALACVPRNGITGSYGSSMFTCLMNHWTCPQWLQHFIFPLSMPRDSISLHLHQHLQFYGFFFYNNGHDGCEVHHAPSAFKLPVQHAGRPVRPEGRGGVRDAVPGSGQQELSLALLPVLIFSNWHPSRCPRSPRYSVSVASWGGTVV